MKDGFNLPRSFGLEVCTPARCIPHHLPHPQVPKEESCYSVSTAAQEEMLPDRSHDLTIPVYLGWVCHWPVFSGVAWGYSGCV